MSRPRIALTGSAGVGKTTLANALSQHLRLPLIPEGMRQRLEAGLDLHTLGRAGLRDLLVTLFEEMVDRSREAVDEAGGFIGDRSVFDVAAFWLYYGFGSDADATDAIMGRVRDTACLYDLIVVLPWGAIPLDDDRVRTPNPWIQLHYQAVIEGILARWAPKTIVVPEGCTALDDRLLRITDALNQSKGRPLSVVTPDR